MIKVIANSTEQAIEIIQAFENSDAKIVIDVKENTTTENGDVSEIHSWVNLNRAPQNCSCCKCKV